MCGGQFDTDRLSAALSRIPNESWSLASAYRDTGVHHGYRRVVLVSAGHWQPHADLFGFVWDALNPVWDAWLSWIEPGGFIVPHRDPGPWRERWQVPISPSGQWCGKETFEPTAGNAFMVEHWAPHAVANRGATPRIHLVVDRNIHIDRDAEPFATFPVPAEMADLVDRSRQ